jgi:hypothetical protein
MDFCKNTDIYTKKYRVGIPLAAAAGLFEFGKKYPVPITIDT